MNDRRQEAASWGWAARVPLATLHLPPDAGALPLSFTIKLKPTWLQVLLAFSLAPAIVLFWFAFFLLVGINPLVDRAFLPFIAIGALITLLPFIGLRIVRMLLPQHLEITPQGLTVRHALLSRIEIDWPLRTRKIRWNQVWLFAIRDGKPGTPAAHYELSSSFVVVQWARVRRPRWWSLHRPAIPFAEYDAQMEALIALITGITGLPLYDVR